MTIYNKNNKINYYNNMRICYITFRSFPLVAIVPACISLRIFNAGHSVTVLSPSNTDKYINEYYKGIKIVKFGKLRNRFEKKNMIYFLYNCIKYIKNNDFDIIHIFSCPYFGFLSLFGPHKTAYIYHMLSYPLSSSRYRIWRSKLSIFFNCLFMDKIIIQSKELKDNMQGIKSFSRTCVIPTGFDNVIMANPSNDEKQKIREKLEIPDGDLVVIFVGSIQKVRKIENLIYAFNCLFKKRKNIVSIIIGDGNYFKEMVELINSISIKDKIRVLGRINHDFLAQYISIADIGISYVPINEIFNFNPPVKTFELLAMGLPIVATNTISNSLVVKNRENGILVSDKPDDLANGIIELVDNLPLREKLKRNAASSVKDFSFDKITKEKIIPLYEKLILNSSQRVFEKKTHNLS